MIAPPRMHVGIAQPRVLVRTNGSHVVAAADTTLLILNNDFPNNVGDGGAEKHAVAEQVGVWSVRVVDDVVARNLGVDD